VAIRTMPVIAPVDIAAAARNPGMR
jgi:hypothetical protein